MNRGETELSEGGGRGERREMFFYRVFSRIPSRPGREDWGVILVNVVIIDNINWVFFINCPLIPCLLPPFNSLEKLKLLTLNSITYYYYYYYYLNEGLRIVIVVILFLLKLNFSDGKFFNYCPFRYDGTFRSAMLRKYLGFSCPMNALFFFKELYPMKICQTFFFVTKQVFKGVFKSILYWMIFNNYVSTLWFQHGCFKINNNNNKFFFCCCNKSFIPFSWLDLVCLTVCSFRR